MIKTPCVGVCQMTVVAGRTLCDGCLRTLEEIARWRSMPDEERARVMEELPSRRCAG